MIGLFRRHGGAIQGHATGGRLHWPVERETALALPPTAAERRTDLFDALLVVAIFGGMGALA